MIQLKPRGRPRKEKVIVDEVKILINKILIRNFKSIKNIEINLRPGVNVLVGSNGSGKTNILEAIYFLYKSLIEAPGRVPYISHTPEYWRGIDLIFNRDPSQLVVLGFELEAYTKSTGTYCRKWMRSTLKYRVTYSYDNVRDTLVPVHHEYVMNDDTILTIDVEKIIIKIKNKLLNRIKRTPSIREQLVKHGFKEVTRNGRSEMVFELRSKLAEHPVLPLRPLVIVTRSLISPRRIALVDSVGFRGGSGEAFKALVPVWAYEKCVNYARGYRIYPRERGEGVDVLTGRASFPTVAHMALLVPGLISEFILLKHPDIGAVSEPRRFEGKTRIDPRAKNLADVLLTLRGKKGGRLEILEDLISRGFPGYSIRVESSHGRVFLVAEEDGLELPPSNMPDGLIKLVAIGLSLEFSPSLMLIDEIENSMHASLLEVVFDALNTGDIPVLVATHSPIIIDLAGPERIIIVRKTREEGTTIERIRDPEALSEALEREGIVLSDYVIQSLTRED